MLFLIYFRPEEVTVEAGGPGSYQYHTEPARDRRIWDAHPSTQGSSTSTATSLDFLCLSPLAYTCRDGFVLVCVFLGVLRPLSAILHLVHAKVFFGTLFSSSHQPPHLRPSSLLFSSPCILPLHFPLVTYHTVSRLSPPCTKLTQDLILLLTDPTFSILVIVLTKIWIHSIFSLGR